MVGLQRRPAKKYKNYVSFLLLQPSCSDFTGKMDGREQGKHLFHLLNIPMLRMQAVFNIVSLKHDSLRIFLLPDSDAYTPHVRPYHYTPTVEALTPDIQTLARQPRTLNTLIMHSTKQGGFMAEFGQFVLISPTYPVVVPSNN